MCDDAVTFIIAAMREFKNDAEMQTESCMALASLNRAVSSATGHNAWSAIIDTMENHTTNVIVQVRYFEKQLNDFLFFFPRVLSYSWLKGEHLWAERLFCYTFSV